MKIGCQVFRGVYEVQVPMMFVEKRSLSDRLIDIDFLQSESSHPQRALFNMGQFLSRWEMALSEQRITYRRKTRCPSVK
jgi:hypothetical protein